MTKTNLDVSGTWMGNYYYSSLSQGSGFEAVFAQQGTAVEGSILDDGYLGEAHLTGSCVSGELSFCKIYNSKARDPVHYQGQLSEDGKSVSGTWRINATCHGFWKAWRLDDEQLPDTLETDEEVDREKELVRPMAMPMK